MGQQARGRRRYSFEVAGDDPRNWRLDISQAHIDLYFELGGAPRALTPSETQMMVELVDAWRALEHQKHMAFESVRSTPEAQTNP